MTIKLLTTPDEACLAAVLARNNHSELQAAKSFLPQKTVQDFQPRIEWMMKEGKVYGSFDNNRLRAFLGTFTIDDFRNEGKGSLTPDWCIYADPTQDGRRELLALYRTLIKQVLHEGIDKHSVGIYSHREDIKDFFELIAYGRIVMDAAASQPGLMEILNAAPAMISNIEIRRAQAADASVLSSLDSCLAEHISAVPVLMPCTHSGTKNDWEQWLGQDDTAAFVAFENENAVGFIKAQDPQFDVTFSVHDSRTFAINGLFVQPECRGKQIARSLLKALVAEAEKRKKTLVSVDCETMNQEAYSFWSRYFTPLSWSMLRRF
jgi:GNAT superfamily N-acetyltransferase